MFECSDKEPMTHGGSITVETKFGPMEIRAEAADQAVVTARGLRVNGIQYDASVRMFQGLQGVWTARSIFDVHIVRANNAKQYGITEAARRAILIEMSVQLRLWTEACEWAVDDETSKVPSSATSRASSGTSAPGGMRCHVEGHRAWFLGLIQDDTGGFYAVVRFEGEGLMLKTVSPSKVEHISA